MKNHNTETNKVYYSVINDAKVEVTNSNLEMIKAAGTPVFEQIIPSKGHISPMAVVVPEDCLDDAISDYSIDTSNTTEQYHAHIDGLAIAVTDKNYQAIADSDAIITYAKTSPEYISPMEITVSPEKMIKSFTSPVVPESYIDPAPVDAATVPLAQTLQVPQIFNREQAVTDIVPADKQESSIADVIPAKNYRGKKENYNAAVMAEHLLKKYRFIKLNNAVYVWTGHYYKFIDSNRLEELCTQEYYDIFIETGSSNLLKSVIKFIFPMIPDGITPLDASHLIMFNNGAFDLNTGNFSPYSTYFCNYFIKHSVNADFMTNAECPAFEDYLYTLAGGNPLLIRRFWEVTGMLISSDIRAKRITALIGTGGSGKTTYGSIIEMLISDGNVTAYNTKGLVDKFSGARLINSSINKCMDMACIPLDSDVVAKLKNFSGGDLIEGDVKFMPAFSYVYSGHLLFGSNYPIKITYIDEAFAERILLLPCDYKVPLEKRDPHLLDKIKVELSAIATKAAYAFYNVCRNKYVFTGDDIWKVSAEDLCSSISDINEDIVFKFINISCEVTNSQEDYILIAELFKAFAQFCEQNGYRNNYSCNAFSKAIKQLVPSSETKKVRIGTSTANARTCIRLAEQA